MACRRLVLLLVLALAACEHEPLDYIPPTDRALLQAQARLGDAGGPARPLSVDEMLRRARTANAAAAPDRLVLQFAPDAAQLDEAQKAQLSQFATSARGRAVSVTARRGTGDASLLGPRRAVAVARALSTSLTDVRLRFTPDSPTDAVVVSLASPTDRSDLQ